MTAHARGITAADPVALRKQQKSDRESARQKVDRALREGRLTRPTICSRCDAEPGVDHAGNPLISADWPRGYAKPLDVEWICRRCARHGGEPSTSRSDFRKPMLNPISLAPPTFEVAIVINSPSGDTWSPRDPNVISIRGQNVTRHNATVRITPLARRLLLILAVRQHCMTSNADLIDALWGDDPEGGPDTAEKVIDVAVYMLRDAGAALGFRIERQHARGYTLRTIAYVDRGTADAA